jgi:hypothetical protein
LSVTFPETEFCACSIAENPNNRAIIVFFIKVNVLILRNNIYEPAEPTHVQIKTES